MTAPASSVSAPAPVDSMRRAMAWMGLAAIAWAFLEIALGAMFHRPPPLLQVVWWRYGVHLCVVWLIWGVRGARLVSTKRRAFHIGRSSLMLVMPASYVLALHFGGTVDAINAVFWSAPLLAIAFGVFFAREAPPAPIVMLAILGWAVSILIYVHMHGISLAVVLAAFVQACSLSLYFVMTRDLRDEPVQTNLFYTAAPVFAVLTPFMPWIFVAPDLHDAIIFSMIGVVGLGTLFAIDRACAAGPTWMSANALFLQALASVILMLSIYDMAATLRLIIGMAAIVGLVGAQFLFSAKLASPRAPRAVG
jgi:drug/metabolite transporter (DMT)-like permease